MPYFVKSISFLSAATVPYHNVNDSVAESLCAAPVTLSSSSACVGGMPLFATKAQKVVLYRLFIWPMQD